MKRTRWLAPEPWTRAHAVDLDAMKTVCGYVVPLDCDIDAAAVRAREMYNCRNCLLELRAVRHHAGRRSIYGDRLTTPNEPK